ncbi:Detected protein of unknown function [Hibiscus syriacus]|uniref:Uncharacterized protein n=1 Tax=Hibiscus syriacus TaxID=106335 RepID=A0A6A2YFI7_HIBSY|nr:Detected protein of unknown function [Hibiscus syriacus]
MDVLKTKGKKNMLVKAWERCRSLGNTGKKSSATPSPLMRKSKSCHVFPSIEEEEEGQVLSCSSGRLFFSVRWTPKAKVLDQDTDGESSIVQVVA